MDIFKKAQELFKKEIDAEKSKNFIVCIMGQTGTGKSSLTNSLFGTNFKTDC